MTKTGLLVDCDVLPQFPDWAGKERPIDQHIPCGRIDPSRLEMKDVFLETDGEDLGDEEWAKGNF